MKFPQKIEINIEDEFQGALLYSCFNKTFNDVMSNLAKSRKFYAKSIYIKHRNETTDNNFILKCWEKVNGMFEKKEDSKESKHTGNKRLAKIKVEAFFKNGEEFYKILEFENIRQEKQLPHEYLLQMPKFFLSPDKSSVSIFWDEISGTRFFLLCLGGIMNKKEFNEILKVIKDAGERLTQIKKEERDQHKKESNIIEFII